MEGARMIPRDATTVDLLRQLERKVLWLSTYMIHHANHEVDRGDGLKVGGHQASSASLSTLMTALYFHILRPEDRVAVKPHASPVFHAIQYLLGHQTLDNLKNFRGFGGAQSYPSRTKDADDVDFSTGSVGLGVAVTGFASLVQDYVHAKGWSRDSAQNWPKGRMVALVGDAELDEGNVHEALLEFWKHGLDNCWWVIDYNRQSLDSVVSDRLFMKMAGLFENLGWKVVLIKYGKLLQSAFAEPGGQRLRQWIDDCPNMLYSALVFQGGAAWRRQLEEDLALHPDTLDIVRRHDDAELARLMTNLGGHDMEAILEAFGAAPTGQPVCFIAYTIKGLGLPFQGHKDNHAGLMTKAQLNEFRVRQGINQGEEWDKFAGLDVPQPAIEGFLARAPFAQKGRRRLEAARISVDGFPDI
jgi:pyruvate dehydrogenase E1 component